jgi:hypothetical protein
MGVVATLASRILPTGKDDPAMLERQLNELRATIEKNQTDANRLAENWLSAPDGDTAEQIDRARREALRLAQRDQARIPHLEASLASARAVAQAELLARHRKILAAIYPRLRAALDLAAKIQVEAIVARNKAIAQLSEGLVAQHLAPVAYLGFLLPDLIQLWADDQDRIWAPKAPAPKPPAAQPKTTATAKANAAAQPDPAPPRPLRPLRHDPPPPEGQASVIFLRPGIDFADGQQSLIGDTVNVPADVARALVQRGAADYVQIAKEAGVTIAPVTLAATGTVRS